MGSSGVSGATGMVSSTRIGPVDGLEEVEAELGEGVVAEMVSAGLGVLAGTSSSRMAVRRAR
jgi:hypothetical protein